MHPFLYLVMAHLIADYPLQGNFLATAKKTHLFLLLTHALMWALVISATLTWLGLFTPWKLAFLFAGHAVIDWWKCHFAEPDKALTSALWVDQALHLCQLVIVFVI